MKQLFTALVISGLFCSCASGTKNKKTVDIEQTETSRKEKDSLQVQKKDSTETTRADSSTVKVRTYIGEIQLDFDDTDTGRPTGPIIIFERNDSTIVNTGGRRLKGATKKTSTQNRDSSGTSQSKTVAVGTENSLHVKLKDTASKKTIVATSETSKVKINLGLILSILGVILALSVVWLVYFRKRKKDQPADS